MKKRVLSLALAAVMCLFVLSSCNKAETQTEKKSPYEESVPASYSANSGVERESASKYNPTKIDQRDKTGYTVCVDPGHGFYDGGCGEGFYSDGTLEKDITMAIATKLTERLSLLGYTVIQTHDGVNEPAQDTNMNHIFSATERVIYANSLDIDYLVSVHVNALDSDTSVKGMHIYYQQSSVKQNTWGAAACDSIAKSIVEEVPGAKKPIIKDGTDPNTSFALTRDVTAASSLIEVGFVTNEEDAENMIDPDWQQVVANAIADGIDNFFKGLAEQK